MLGLELDDGVGRLRLVRRQLSEIFITPVRKIDDPRRLRNLGRWFDNVQPVVVEEESVIPEQIAQLRNHGMIVGELSGMVWA